MKGSASTTLIEWDTQDTLIFKRLAFLLDMPKTVILRWALRYYALHAPLLRDTDEGNSRVLEGIEELVTGLGIREKTGWHADNGNRKTPPPSRRRRRA